MGGWEGGWECGWDGWDGWEDGMDGCPEIQPCASQLLSYPTPRVSESRVFAGTAPKTKRLFSFLCALNAIKQSMIQTVTDHCHP